ncbi:TOBE domain-containing protein [Variovorax paradoxus]|uniref:TOBE domain-containing protein n=1 Tax=Variovorax paradoxus TaxID=34073 RepID=UPI0021AD1C9F|nr:TOBE domain-containing protein [Variovorax paradoxus]UVH59919.1 TOBE domain-containing protein [Variovorax paradoxus]
MRKVWPLRHCGASQSLVMPAGAAAIVSTFTSNSADSLKLTEGANAYAVIKASSVMVGTD